MCSQCRARGFDDESPCRIDEVDGIGILCVERVEARAKLQEGAFSMKDRRIAAALTLACIRSTLLIPAQENTRLVRSLRCAVQRMREAGHPLVSSVPRESE